MDFYILGWVKLNCDSTFSHNSGRATGAGIFRDSSGYWLKGYVKNLEVQEGWEAQLEATICGLTIAIQHGWQYLLVESDALPVITGLISKDASSYNHPLFVRGRYLLQFIPNAQVTRIFWEANHAADALCKLNLGRGDDIVELRSQSIALNNVVERS